MKNYRLTLILLLLISLLISCADPFGVTDLFCTSVTRCLNGNGLLYKGSCKCRCSEGFCGDRCGYDKSICKGTVTSPFDASLCECICPTLGGISFEPPGCDKLVVSLTAFELPPKKRQIFNQILSKPNEVNYFPLYLGNSWTYSILDSSGIEANQFGLFVKNIISRNDTNFIAVNLPIPDSTGIISDTVVGPLFFRHPSDSTQIYQIQEDGSSEFFMPQQLNFGDTLFFEIDEYNGDTLYTVVDSLPEVIVPADTFFNCAYLRDQSNSGLVLAPEIGLIANISNGEFVSVLSSLKVSCNTRIEIKTIGTSCISVDDGRFEINVIGDDTGLNYEWDGPSFIGNESNPKFLSPGLYNLTVSNDNCQAIIKELPIIQADPIIISVDQIVQPDCLGNNGSIEISISGGEAPYWYSWNDGAFLVEDLNNLGPGCYELEVMDDKGCSHNITVDLQNPETIDLSFDILNVSCHDFMDGSITLIIDGGTPPFNVLWSNGTDEANLQNLNAGSYTATVNDSAGCSDSLSIDITQPNALIVMINTIEEITCHDQADGAISVMVSGGTEPYSYMWNNGEVGNSMISDLVSGDYKATIVDTNGCEAFFNYTLEAPLPLTATTMVTNSISGMPNGTASIQVQGGTPPYSYNWNDAEMQTTDLAVGLSPGSYTIIVTDANGCIFSQQVEVEETTNTADLQKLEISSYPNPTQDYLYVRQHQLTTSFEVHLLNARGELIQIPQYEKYGDQELRFDLKNVGTGLYYLQFKNNKTTRVISVVKI